MLCRTAWPLTCVVLQVMSVTLFALRIKRGLLSPVNPVVAVGQSLKLKCTSQEEGLSSDNMTFCLKQCSNPIPPATRHTISRPNSTTAVLLVTNMTRTMALMCCTHAGERLDGVLALVGYKPHPFFIVSVTVANWEMLTMTWSERKWPEERGIKVFRVSSTAYWKARDEQDFRVCPKHDGTSCSFSLKDQYVLNATYFTVQVTNTNILGTFSTKPRVVQMANINKPAAVQDLEVQRVGADWLQVTWTPATPAGRTLMYAINTTSRFGDHAQVQPMLHERIMSQNITKLHPGTQWKVTVATKSDQGSVWSSPQFIYSKTRDSVPTGLPVTSDGSFDVNVDTQEERLLTVYWKPMPAEFQLGDISAYKIVANASGRSGSYSIEIPSSKCCFHEMALAANETFKVFLTARTSAGYNAQLQPQSQLTVLPEVALRSLRPRNVTSVVTRSNVTEITWSGEKHRRYTGYLCASRNSYGCEGNVTWAKDISSPWVVDLLPVSADPRLFRFGVSADLATNSSGITWSDCVYLQTGISSAPRVRSTVVGDSVNFRLSPAVVCDGYQGFVYAFNITYCATQDSQCEGIPTTILVPSAGRTTLWSPPHLRDDTAYNFTVCSVTAAELSVTCTSSSVTTLPAVDAAVMDNLVGIVIGTLIVFIFVGIGSFCLLRNCGRKCKFYTEKQKIRIRPLEQTIMADSGPADAPSRLRHKYAKPSLTFSMRSSTEPLPAPPDLPWRTAPTAKLDAPHSGDSGISLMSNSIFNSSGSSLGIDTTVYSLPLLDISEKSSGDSQKKTHEGISKQHQMKGDNEDSYPSTVNLAVGSDQAIGGMGGPQWFAVSILSGMECPFESDRTLSFGNVTENEEGDNAAVVTSDPGSGYLATPVAVEVYPSADDVNSIVEADAANGLDQLRDDDGDDGYASTLALDPLPSNVVVEFSETAFPFAIDKLTKADVSDDNNLRGEKEENPTNGLNQLREDDGDDDYASTLALYPLPSNVVVEFSETAFPFATDKLTKADVSDDNNLRGEKEENPANGLDQLREDDGDDEYASTLTLDPPPSNVVVEFSETAFPFSTDKLTKADVSDDNNLSREKEHNFAATVILEQGTPDAFPPPVGARNFHLGSNRAEMRTVGHVNVDLRNVKDDVDDDYSSTTPFDSDGKDVSTPVLAPARLNGMWEGSDFENNDLSTAKDNEQDSLHDILIHIPFGTDEGTSDCGYSFDIPNCFNNNTLLQQKKDDPQNEMDTRREPSSTGMENKFGDNELDSYASMQSLKPINFNKLKKLTEANIVNDQMTLLKANKENDCLSGLPLEPPTFDALWLAVKSNAKDLLSHSKQDDLCTAKELHHSNMKNGDGDGNYDSMHILHPLATTHAAMIDDIQYCLNADEMPTGNMYPLRSEPAQDCLISKISKQDKLGDKCAPSLILSYYSEDSAPIRGQVYSTSDDGAERKPKEDDASHQNHINEDEGNGYYAPTVILNLLNQDIANCGREYPVMDNVGCDPMSTLILHHSSKPNGDCCSSGQEAKSVSLGHEVESCSSGQEGESLSSGQEGDSFSSDEATENRSPTDNYKWTAVLLDKHLLGRGQHS